MKSYNDFISESIVGQVAGFARRAQGAVKGAVKGAAGSARRTAMNTQIAMSKPMAKRPPTAQKRMVDRTRANNRKTTNNPNPPIAKSSSLTVAKPSTLAKKTTQGVRVPKPKSNYKGHLRSLAGAKDTLAKAVSDPRVRTAGSAAKGAFQGFKDYGTQGPVNKATDAGTGFKPGAGGLGKNIGRGINQNTKTFDKAKKTETGKIVQGRQKSGGNYKPVDKEAPEKSEGGGVAKSTSGGGVQADKDKSDTLTGRLGRHLKNKAGEKLGLNRRVQSRTDRAKDLMSKRAGDQLKKGIYKMTQKEYDRKKEKDERAAAYKATTQTRADAKQKDQSKPKDLSKPGDKPGQTIDVKATPVTNTKKPETKPKGSKPSLDDLINDVRGGSSKPKKKSNPDQLNRMAKSQAGSDKTPVIKKAEKGGALVTSTSKLKAPKETSKPGDSYPSKADRIAAHKKKVANLKSKGVKLREELSFWREEFIWETDKKYPDKVKQIKPMTGTNTIEINPEIETDKYRR